MNKPLLVAIAIASGIIGNFSAFAQGDRQPPVQSTQTTTVIYRNTVTNLNRAKNYARQAAEQRNGGLQRYRAEAMMHGPVERTRFVENTDGTVTFTFNGGAPNAKPTIESVVTVAVDGWKTRIDYNGPIRTQSGTIR